MWEKNFMSKPYKIKGNNSLDNIKNVRTQLVMEGVLSLWLRRYHFTMVREDVWILRVKLESCHLAMSNEKLLSFSKSYFFISKIWKNISIASEVMKIPFLYEYLIDGVPCKSTNVIIVISIIYSCLKTTQTPIHTSLSSSAFFVFLGSSCSTSWLEFLFNHFELLGR